MEILLIDLPWRFHPSLSQIKNGMTQTRKRKWRFIRIDLKFSSREIATPEGLSEKQLQESGSVFWEERRTEKGVRSCISFQFSFATLHISCNWRNVEQNSGRIRWRFQATFLNLKRKSSKKYTTISWRRVETGFRVLKQPPRWNTCLKLEKVFHETKRKMSSVLETL